MFIVISRTLERKWTEKESGEGEKTAKQLTKRVGGQASARPEVRAPEFKCETQKQGHDLFRERPGQSDREGVTGREDRKFSAQIWSQTQPSGHSYSFSH